MATEPITGRPPVGVHERLALGLLFVSEEFERRPTCNGP
jgi:hypothetical protein